MLKQRSLRLRLLSGMLVWVCLSLLVGGTVLYQQFYRFVQNEIFDDLHIDATLVETSLGVKPPGVIGSLWQLKDFRYHQPGSGRVWEVDSPGAPCVLRSESLGTECLPAPDVPVDWSADQRHYRIGAEWLVAERRVHVHGLSSEFRIRVGQLLAPLDERAERLRQGLTWAFLLLGCGIFLAAVLLLWLGLLPLARLRAELAEVTGGRQPVLRGDFPSEVAPLVSELNGLLLHQQEVVERGRVLAGNLVHGLKTPLAVITQEVETLDQTGEHDVAARIDAQIQRMQRQIQYHTARARAAAAAAVPGQRCQVAPLVTTLSRVISSLYRDRNLIIDQRIPEQLLFRGERQDLEEMAGNLIENAAKWARSRIDLSVGPEEPGWFTLLVADDGPGLDPRHYGEAFARGRRLDEAVPGSGLGLAIVRDLAEMYHGTVALDRAELGGLLVRLRLPRPPD